MILICLCSVVIIISWLVWNKWELIRVMGISMQPTLNEGDILLVDKQSRVGMGDIVVLPAPDADYLVVKRICSVRFNMEADMFEYWLLGDNRDNSHDSRDYGWIKAEIIEGKVTKVWKTKQQ